MITKTFTPNIKYQEAKKPHNKLSFSGNNKPVNETQLELNQPEINSDQTREFVKKLESEEKFKRLHKLVEKFPRIKKFLDGSVEKLEKNKTTKNIAKEFKNKDGTVKYGCYIGFLLIFANVIPILSVPTAIFIALSTLCWLASIAIDDFQKSEDMFTRGLLI